MNLKRQLCALAGLCTLSAATHATDIQLATSSNQTGYGQWNAFNVSDIDSQTFGVEWIDNANSASPLFGSALSFLFTIDAGSQAALTVVDGAFAGDTFKVTNFGSVIGNTSAVPVQSYATAPSLGYDFDAALADNRFSSATFALGAGTYRISGRLDQSVTDDAGLPLNSTVGAVRLSVSAVPEPSTVLMLVTGLGALGAAARRRFP